MVNYDTANSEAVYKYLLKAFYNKIYKKEYISQIWQHNICYTNIIAIKDVIIEKKTKTKEELLEGIVDTITPAEVARTLGPVDFAKKYMWAMRNTDLDAAEKLGLTVMKKYWKHAGQVEIELD